MHGLVTYGVRVDADWLKADSKVGSTRKICAANVTGEEQWTMPPPTLVRLARYY